MEDSVSKEELLVTIRTALREAEEAIQFHPPETVAVYEAGTAALLKGMEGAPETEWSRTVDLSRENLSLVHRYMSATAFMSAWYGLYGDKGRRDQAAQSAAILVAGLGLDPDKTFMKVLQFERGWKQGLKAGGGVKTGCLVVAGILLIPPLIACVV